MASSSGRAVREERWAARNFLMFVKLACRRRSEGRTMPKDDLSIKTERALVTVGLSTVMLIMCLGSLLYR